VACLALTATACSSNSSSSSSAPATSSAAATTSAPATSAPATTAPAASASTSGSAAGTPAGVPASLTGDAKAAAISWVTFFNYKTPAATRASLLQNGSKFTAALAGGFATQQTSANVTAVTVSGSTAAVTFDLLLSGAPVLQKQKGTAILNGGTWQVSDTSLCALLNLQPTAATKAACTGV
jgi:hypothetical protein